MLRLLTLCYSALMENTVAIVMAAGLGTRMKSRLPKCMHAVGGRPLVHYPVRAALEAGADTVVAVVGHGREHVEAYLRGAFGARVRFAVQEQQRGTGDAARVGLSGFENAARVLIVNGDTPLVSKEDFEPVLHALAGVSLSLATCTLSDPTGYGRVLRDAAGKVLCIREHKDTKSDAERGVREINPGIYAATGDFLAKALAALTPNNAQGEYYITDLVEMAAAQNGVATVASRPEVMEGVNDRRQLAQADRAMQARIVEALRVSGVTVAEGVWVGDGVVCEPDVTLERNVVLRGATKIGRGSLVDVGCVLTDVTVAEDVVLKPYTVAQKSSIGARAQLGPFSHLRPESVLAEDCHIGNFVETKKTTLGKGSKANHLAYLGDGIIGEGVNVGAGTIFCNYDGFQKHTTVLEDGVFIGSDSHLVAPVRVGKGAYVATGTTVTRDVPADALAIARTKQENKEGYAARLRARFKAAKESSKG
jgi:bifunctional UDP-N-acetylglucosamine pyrophosphorylase / glucosamine-1-phosphate N-acetyltransferase